MADASDEKAKHVLKYFEDHSMQCGTCKNAAMFRFNGSFDPKTYTCGRLGIPVGYDFYCRLWKDELEEG